MTHAVSTPHYLSTDAALSVLDAGGNAVDAAIAATATQGVVAPETCGIGGDLFALVHVPGWDKPRAVNASGRAGSGVNPTELRARGLITIPRDHPAVVTAPGCVDGFAFLAADLGSLPLARSLQPAIETAREGFEVSAEQEKAFVSEAPVYAGNPAVAEFYPDGIPVTRGQWVRRPRLAATLEAIATGGRDAFYRGKTAQAITAELSNLLTLEDLAQDHARWVDPIGCTVSGLEAWTIPPNSQGYLGPATLAVFDMLEPPADSDHPSWWHLLIESFRALAWERDGLVADPRHAPLPVELFLDSARLARVADTVNRNRAAEGWPRAVSAGSGTAYLCVVDDTGMAVSMIQSNFFGTGSVFGAGDSGFLLQNRGAGFSLIPGHPNEVRPGKQPLHTLSPTLWLGEGRARWLLGTRGGAYQPQLVAQLGARAIVTGTDLENAQASPRWIVADFGPNTPSVLSLEPVPNRALVLALEARGHRIDQVDQRQPGWGPVSVIAIDGDSKETARDPRVDTTSAVVR